MGETATDRRAPSAMCGDGRRALIALAVSFAVPFLSSIALGILAPSVVDDAATHVVLWLLGWNVFAVVYVALTVRTFFRVDRAEFTRRMDERARRRAWVWRAIQKRGDGPTYAIESALVAFGVVLVLPHVPGIGLNDWVLVPVSMSILLSCWVLSIVSYALHYAQHDLAVPSLEFPGERTNAWADYVYFSIAVATTFGATDVNITTPQMRRVVNVHTTLTFIYNSVIVALLAALLIR